MASNEYVFITRWRFEASAREVSDILRDVEELPRWWPSVYLDVRVLEPGAGNGVGKVALLHTKGWLPYTLRWSFRVTDSQEPFGFSLTAWGDFVGTGVWTIEEQDQYVDVTYDWRIAAEKGLLRWLSPIMKPLFAANHRWAMAKGERSLRLELARRRALTPEERSAIPLPPGPTFPHRAGSRRLG